MRVTTTVKGCASGPSLEMAVLIKGCLTIQGVFIRGPKLLSMAWTLPGDGSDVQPKVLSSASLLQ